MLNKLNRPTTEWKETLRNKKHLYLVLLALDWGGDNLLSLVLTNLRERK
jgi:hypothetical protein